MVTIHDRHGRATETPDGMIIGRGGYAVLEKHRWRTPAKVIDSIGDRLGIGAFDLDACAEDDARWADRWITLHEDCLAIEDWRTKHRRLIPHEHEGHMETVLYEGPPNTEIRHVFMNSPWGGRASRRGSRSSYPGSSWSPFPAPSVSCATPGSRAVSG